MPVYSFTKESIRPELLQQQVVSAGLSSIEYIETVGDQVNIVFPESLDSSDQTLLGSLVTAHSGTLTVPEQVAIAIKAAINFGQVMIADFATQNVLLGITQAGMTNQVRMATSEVISALQTGSLYDAIYEARQIPPEDKDSTFITDARLLAFVNKIEAYLGIALSEEL